MLHQKHMYIIHPGHTLIQKAALILSYDCNRIFF